MVAISLYQRFEKRKNSKILYSPETIKIRLILPQSGGKAAAKASPAPLVAGLGERNSSSQKSEFVSYSTAPKSEFLRTFEIVLPNLIYKMQETKSKLTKLPAPPAGGAGRKTRRLAGKKFPPLEPLHFLPACLTISLNFMRTKMLTK